MPRYDQGSDVWSAVREAELYRDMPQPEPLERGSYLDKDVVAIGKAPKNSLAARTPNGSYNIKQNPDGSYDVNPSTSQKIAGIVGGVSSIASNYIGQQAMVKNESELMNNAGMTNSSVGGVGYRRYNDITGNQELSNLDRSGFTSTLSSTASGASAGAAFGPWGAAIGGVVGLASGIFGWSSSKAKLRKRIYNAQQLANRNNIQARSGAMGTALQNNYYSEHGGLDGGTLYANKGKDKWQET